MSLTSPPADPNVVAALRALASGHLAHARDVADALVDASPLIADIVRADVAGRMAEIGCAQLRDLDAHVAVEAPDDQLLHWWVVAVLGERALLDADLGAVPLAVQALAEMPVDLFGPTPVLYVRGRLRRIAAAAYLASPSPETVARHLELRDAAIADFLRCDFPAEAALTRGLAAALAGIATGEDVVENLTVVEDVRATLGDQEGSIWIPLLDQLTVLVAVAAGELAIATDALDAFDTHRGGHRVFDAFSAFGRAAVQVATTGASPEAVDTMTGALDWLKRAHPQLVAQTQLQAANLCADHGAEAARRFGAAGLDWPPVSPPMALRGRLLAIRLDTLVGRPHPVATIVDLLDQLDGLGQSRMAGATALRMAGDHVRTGAAEPARTLAGWGLVRLPDDARRSAAERRWVQAAATGDAPSAATIDLRAPRHEGDGDGRAAPAADPPRRRAGDRVAVSVRVLSPTLEVEVRGRPVELRDMAAKLLLTLVVSHPSPVHVERAVDVLWPELDPVAGRRRLNTVVYRLRRELALDPSALRRSGDVLVLDPDGWTIDLVHWRQDVADDDVARAGEALRSVRGNLCQVQFPYDELFVEERRGVAALAALAIRRITRAADTTPAGLDQAMARLDPEAFPVTS